MRSLQLTVAAALLCSVGCSFHARDPDSYRADTRELMDTRSPDIKDCYDVALQTDEDVGGTVVVNFTVEPKTGKVLNPTVDQGRTDAPDELALCVVSAIDGLQLDPPDAREGLATFAWNFKADKPAAPPPAG